MIVTCHSCDTPFEVEESSAPQGGVRLLCPECDEPVSLGLPGDEAEPGEEILEGTLLPEDDFSDLGEPLDDLEQGAGIERTDVPVADGAAGPAPAKPVAIGAIELESVPASSLKSRAASRPGSGDTRKRFGKLGRGLGWAIALGLVALALFSVLRQGSESMADVEQTLDVGPLRVESLRGEWVDTMAGRTLLAVTGNLYNPTNSSRTPGALLEVSLVGSDDRRLVWPPEAMGLRLSESEIRELPPTALETAQKKAAGSLARTKVPPGGSVPVQAIFLDPPPDAVRFELELGASVGSGQGD